MSYWSSRDRWWLRLLKISLGNDSLRELAAREISLLIFSAPGEYAAAIAWEGSLEHAYFFTGWRGFVSVVFIWILLSVLTRKLRPSLV
jgi:hypothetical protein